MPRKISSTVETRRHGSTAFNKKSSTVETRRHESTAFNKRKGHAGQRSPRRGTRSVQHQRRVALPPRVPPARLSRSHGPLPPCTANRVRRRGPRVLWRRRGEGKPWTPTPTDRGNGRRAATETFNLKRRMRSTSPPVVVFRLSRGGAQL